MPLNGFIIGEHAWTRPASHDEDQVPLFDGLEWLPVYPVAVNARRAAPWLTQFIAFVAPDGSVGWLPTYPNQFWVSKARPWLQFLALPVQVTVYTGDRAVPIHVPDEAPPDQELRISVEHDVGGASVPFDVPPSVRVYYLDATGAQVVVLPYTVTTQYGANPSYYVDWTPAAVGKYIVEVLGTYLALPVVGVTPLTIRAKFDSFALADSDILVSRNGDVPNPT